MSIDLSALSTRQALTAVYIGYYDRAADPAGIEFWEQVVANTSLDLVAITTDFAGQAETQAVHPFFADPATSSPATFITSLYQNLFNRDPDEAGLAFWSAALQDAIDGVEGAISVGEIITAIIEGAVDVEGGTQDRTTILNKIEVGLDWTTAAEAAEIDFTTNTAAQASAKAIIEGVTSDAATVTAAKDSIANDPVFGGDTGGGGGTPGETMFLTSDTDVMTGTENDDTFNAYIQQNPFAGGVSNSLASADRLDGGAGQDRLYAELSYEFLGVDALGAVALDLQPRIAGIEEIDIEARDTLAFGGPGFGGSVGLGTVAPITVDAKNIVDHVEIGSYYSDGDLYIENVTTLTSGGTARNTSEITVTMDHTDNFNTDGDASDLTVLFDNDYLLSGQESEGRVFYFLLDEDAELAGLEARLNNIDVDGIRFNITNADGTVTAVTIEAQEANDAGTHQGFVNALQAPLQALIADGTLPAGTTLVLDPTLTDETFLDDGSQSDDIPAIVLQTGDGSQVIATGFSRIEEPIGEYDVYGRIGEINETADQPISIDIDLHKAGRGGDGGDLIVGGKSESTPEGIADGIEVFNISVLGAGNDDPNGNLTKPSNVGTITSTGNELAYVNIVTDPEFASGSTYADLVVRNGFDESLFSNIESGDLMMINADGFLGNLTLGVGEGRITNADTITAQGGGDVALNLLLDGTEVAQAYSVTTAGGADTVDMVLDGDALDYQGSSVNVSTGAGDDNVEISFDVAVDPENNQLNNVILDGTTVSTGSGDDVVDVDNVGQATIMTGTGNDVVYTDGNVLTKEIWAFNYDDVRAPDLATLGNFAPEDLPGEALSLAYLDNAVITVTLSGAGVAAGGVAGYAAGGGLMSTDAAPDAVTGASRLDDGYEANATITSLLNGNQFFGDQRDINAAITRAIETSPVLSNLLTVVPGANNTIAIVSTTAGAFDATDLRIEIATETYTSSTYAASVVSEARTLFADSSIVAADLFVSTAAGSAYDGHLSGYGADLSTSTTADMYYDGLSARGDTANSAADNTHTNGSVSMAETDNTIDGGEGNDLIVLSTDASGVVLDGSLTAPVGFTFSAANALINGASNETIVLTGNSFGNDTVMNFTANEAQAGLDFLDFTAYLTSQFDFSPGTPGTGSDSFRDIATTLDTNLTAVAANEVAIVDFTAATGETFGGITASTIAAAFNNTDGTGDYGSIDDATTSAVGGLSSTAVVNGEGKAIVMVHNTANDGEYKVFEVEWNAGATTPPDPTVTVTDLGELDFGDQLDNGGGTDATFLVGSAAYDLLFV